MSSPSPETLLFETKHWIVEQRSDAALPGYLLMCAKQNTTHLWELDSEALAEMGGHLARVQKLMMEVLKPIYLYIGRYGHMKGPSFHFHFIPIYDWVVESFLKDERYRSLKQFQSRADGVFADRQFDASELQLYVWREFCESPTSPKIKGPSVLEAIELLKS
ncbi:MAG: hypothetical protein K2W97_08550 [Chthoniobacterales bacterium]|nr:hypothetical protein [Chthoniobacterales bacterium]